MHGVCTWKKKLLPELSLLVPSAAFCWFRGVVCDQLCGDLEWLCWKDLSGSNSCCPLIALESLLLEFNGNMNGKALDVPSIASQKAPQLKYTAQLILLCLSSKFVFTQGFLCKTNEKLSMSRHTNSSTAVRRVCLN